MSKKITARYSKTRTSVTRALQQYDYGQILVFEGDEFSDMLEVHFSNEGDSKATVVFGNKTGVRIPDKYLKTGKNIVAMVYSHMHACDGETTYKVLIPVEQRGAFDGSCTPSGPVEYIFDGKDAGYEDTTPCKVNEYIFDGRDASDT